MLSRLVEEDDAERRKSVSARESDLARIVVMG